ncbi:MAG: tRNA lysidine(34) synthetase TilS [Microthrixaceae bacterium]
MQDAVEGGPVVGGTAAQSPARPDPTDPVLGALLRLCWFPERDHLDVAVSGGADSLCLLALAMATGAAVTAHHVDHGTRPGGHTEADSVAEVCRAWGTGFVAHRVEVPAGPNLEERWRDARRAVLPEGCLTGHTADDQAETLLLRLMRGTGPAGMAAMEPATHPILALRRTDTEMLCSHLGLVVFEDPTNSSGRFARNRVRHEVLPLLSEIAGRDVVPLLTRTAELAGAQREFIAEVVGAVDPTDSAAVGALSEHLAAEVLRSWWTTATDGLPPPDRAALRRMLQVVNHDATRCDVASGWVLARTAGRLRLVRGS